MIVRCSHCNSAFAVDDSKVDNKKFAFTCPKCTTENIIDNRTSEPAEEPVAVASDTGTGTDTGDSFFEAPQQEETEGASSESTAAELTAPAESAIATETPAEDEGLTADFSAEDTEPAVGEMDRLEETGTMTEEEPDMEIDLGEDMPEDLDLDMDLLAETGKEEPPETGTPADDDLGMEIDLEGGLELEGPAEEVSTETGETEIPEASDDLDLDVDSSLIMEEETVSTDEAPAAAGAPKAPSLEEENEIDLADLDEETVATGAEEEELDIDLEGLEAGIDLEEGPGEEVSGEEEIPSLDSDLDFSAGLDEIEETPEVPEDLDINLDPGAGEIPSAEPELSEPGEDISQTLREAEDVPPGDDEALDLTIDDMDISLDEMEAAVSEAAAEDDITADFEPVEEDMSGEISLDDEIVTEEVYTREEPADDEDESITIDLDSLDIELEEGGEDIPASAELSTEEVPAGGTEIKEPEEDDITLDLDTLDIDLAEEETIHPGAQPGDLDITPPEFSDEKISDVEEDESITLDLDSLDIEIAETNEFASGELPEEDEKLTLEDAGLTLDELTAEEIASATGDETFTTADEEEEDIRLSIDEIDPNLKHELENELQEAEDILTDIDDDLPEIDLDEYEAGTAAAATGFAGAAAVGSAIDLDESLETTEKREDIERAKDSVKNGSVSFSIDYSLKYSRLGALARLFLLFMVGMLPHFLVLLVYSLLSSILGFINHIVVISTKNSVEDFSEIIENTIRYSLAVNTSLIGIVEEMPVFAGKKDIDYAMQMNITYPLAYSRLLAALRLSGVGIFLMTLPHILILLVIGAAIPIFWLTGIISVLATARWPHFLFDILMRYYRYMARVMAFMTGLVDKYPPFTF